MDVHSVLGVALLAAALIVVVVVTAAEAGVVYVRPARVRAFATKGVPRAHSLDNYVYERQAMLGTIAIARDVAVVLAIAVGTFLVFRETGSTWLALGVTMAGAVLALTVLEAVPRLVVARNPERWGLRLVPVMDLFRFTFGFPARFLEAAAGRVFNLRKETPSLEEADEEELLHMAEMQEENGTEENGELAMIRRIAHMVDRSAREIMAPRIDMVAVEADDAVQDVLRLVVERGYSRIPVYEETIDNVVGVVYAKDILTYLADGRQPPPLREIARAPFFIPEGKHIDELLTELRKDKVHMAIVVDEYGGTAGLVTIEDVLEEIVGEIQDEFDREEVTIQRLSENEAVLDARVGLEALNELFDLEVLGEDFDTVGGFVYHQLGRMPAPGDEVRADGLTLRVLSVMGRRIKKVRATKEDAAQQGDGTGEKETQPSS